MKLIVGLGNPGGGYAHTRHNAGFMALDRLAAQLGGAGEKKLGQALVRSLSDGGQRLLLAKPQSYMNLSGGPVWQILVYYKDAIDGIIVVHDDLDLPLGRIRFKSSGGTGGHRGLQSITARLGSDVYDRLKIGIGRPASMPAEAYVLQAFADEEKAVLDEVLDEAARGLRFWATEGCTLSMNQFNAVDLRHT